MKRVLKWFSNVFIGILIILVAFSIYSMIQSRNNPGMVPSILGYKPMSVLSGSMRPALEPGDMIVAREVNPSDIKIDDIITYKVSENILVTHRVVQVINENGELLFRTKGDANNVEDSSLISPEQLVGAFVFNIPKGGYIANFMRSPLGFGLLILLPIILLLGGELKNLLSNMASENRKSVSQEDSKVIK